MTKDPKYLNKIRELKCMACGASPPSEAHHVKNRGNGGGDDFFNIIPLCPNCHTQNGVGHAWHRGKILFLKNYPHVMKHLERLGWRVFNGKLIHDPELIDL